MSKKTIMVLVLALVAISLSCLNMWIVFLGKITLTEFLLGQAINMIMACAALIVSWIPDSKN